MCAVAIQVVLGAFLSLAYGANSAHTSFGILAMIGHLHDSGTVLETANLGMLLRCVSAVGAAFGTLLWGKRLAPITGLHLIEADKLPGSCRGKVWNCIHEAMSNMSNCATECNEWRQAWISG